MILAKKAFSPPEPCGLFGDIVESVCVPSFLADLKKRMAACDKLVSTIGTSSRFLSTSNGHALLAVFLCASYVKSLRHAVVSSLSTLSPDLVEATQRMVDVSAWVVRATSDITDFVKTSPDLVLAKNFVGAATEFGYSPVCGAATRALPKSTGGSAPIRIGCKLPRGTSDVRVVRATYLDTVVTEQAPSNFNPLDVQWAERVLRGSQAYGEHFARFLDAALSDGRVMRACSGDSERVLSYRFYPNTYSDECVCFRWRGEERKCTLLDARFELVGWVRMLLSRDRPRCISGISKGTGKGIHIVVSSSGKAEIVIEKLRKFIDRCTRQRLCGSISRRIVVWVP